MRMGYVLDVVQTQKLIMTPELRQAIAILQFSSLELGTYVEQQLQENPLLEIGEDFENVNIEGQSLAESEIGGKDKEKERENEYDIDWQDYFQDSSDLGMTRSEMCREQNDYSYENYISIAPNLMEHLMRQLGLVKCVERKRIIAEYIIGNINDHGYLSYSINDIAKQVGASTDEVLNALKIVQTFDPPGVGARSLQECLLLQLKYLNLDDDLLVCVVVESYLTDLADGKYNRIAQVLGVPVQEVQRVADLLKTLDPKPGRNFSNLCDNRYIVPDIVLNKVDGEYEIITNDTSVPRLTINSTYRAVLGQGKGDSQTKKFVENKLNAAAWLIKSIEQRRLTLYKVTKCLIDLQRDFLDYGVKHLKPLNLKTVADIVGLHESTVSRATSNKYIQTPLGVFEMKYFFSSGLSSIEGSAVSAESIKKTLQEIVEGEDTKTPLNDQQIADMFNTRGVKISRRTVAKYRDEMNIPPIRKRKRY